MPVSTKRNTGTDTKIGKNGRIEIYKSRNGKFNARLRARNGDVIVRTSESYDRKVAAINAVKAMARYFGAKFSVADCDSGSYIDLTK